VGYIKLHKNEVCKFARYMKRTLASFFMGKFALKMNLIVCQQIRMR
jgi:hypothetical protein